MYTTCLRGEKMERQAVAKRLFTIVDNSETDEKKRVKRICLCGTSVLYAADGCQVCHPGTPLWNGLNEAEEGDEIEITLPARTLRVTVQAIETPPVLASIAA